MNPLCNSHGNISYKRLPERGTVNFGYKAPHGCSKKYIITGVVSAGCMTHGVVAFKARTDSFEKATRIIPTLTFTFVTIGGETRNLSVSTSQPSVEMQFPANLQIEKKKKKKKKMPPSSSASDKSRGLGHNYFRTASCSCNSSMSNGLAQMQ